MTRGRHRGDRLLRWYPAEWRHRYGDELAALVEDTLDGRPPPVRLRLSLACAGTAERLRSGGVVGTSRPPAEWLRAGALVVLAAWAGVVVAAGAFAKVSEHFATVAPPASLGTARAAFDLVAAAGAFATLSVVAGALVAQPAAMRFLWSGGWPGVRRPVLRAGVATAVVAGALPELVRWAHRLDVAQRNGADPRYSTAFVGWAVAAGVALALWTAAGVGLARRIDLGPRVLRVEAALAVGVAVAAAVIGVSVAVWWATMARVAPWFLSGSAPGTRPSTWTADRIGVEGLLAVAVVVAAYGLVRVLR